MAGFPPNQVPTYIPVNWSHVKEQDVQELDEILTNIMHGQPRLLVFAHTIGANMVAQAFDQALKNHMPAQHHVVYITADAETVTVRPAISSQSPIGNTIPIIPTTDLFSSTTHGLVNDTNSLQVQPATQTFGAMAPPPPPQQLGHMLPTPAQGHFTASPLSFPPAQPAVSVPPTGARPVVNPPHVESNLHDPYVSPVQQARPKAAGSANKSTNPFNFGANAGAAAGRKK